MADWIPSKAHLKLQALQNFSRGLAERPEVYGVSPSDAAEAVRLVGEFDAAALAAASPATRTTLTIAAKKDAQVVAEKFCRRLAQFIRLNLSIGEADLMLLGLQPKVDKPRGATPPPTTTALLTIRRVIPGGHEIEFADSATPDRRGKPDGVKGLELFVAYSPLKGPDDAALAMDTIIRSGKPYGVLTRSLARIIHPNERVGSIANYVGRWIGSRNEAGPFSQPVRMVLAMPGDGKLSEAA